MRRPVCGGGNTGSCQITDPFSRSSMARVFRRARRTRCRATAGAFAFPAFAFPLSWSVTVCAGVAILALCAAIYGTIGYVDEKRLAVAERIAVEHAIRTNADLQRQLDRARDALPASGARIETASAATEPKPALAVSAAAAIDRAPPPL